MTRLKLNQVCAGYGGGDIVHDIDLTVEPSEVVAIVGPNGAGKSTLLKALAGVAQVTSGTLTLGGQDLVSLSPSHRANAGMVFMPQERNVFRTLSVAENLSVSAWGQKDLADRQREVLRLLPTLAAYMGKRAGGLSGGQRQMTGLGMALMSKPRFLLVDEPTAGLSPILVKEMLDVLQGLSRSAEIGVLIVEQNARAALHRADRALVLVDGRVIRSGQASDIAAEPNFGALFFGHAA